MSKTAVLLISLASVAAAALPAKAQTVVSTLPIATTQPVAVSVDGSGTMYIAEYNNPGRVLKVTANGVASTLATMTPLYGLAVDPTGTVYVSEQYLHRIQKITPT